MPNANCLNLTPNGKYNVSPAVVYVGIGVGLVVKPVREMDIFIKSLYKGKVNKQPMVAVADANIGLRTACFQLAVAVRATVIRTP